jgi:cell wall-associated NlpC family hydrolase
VCSSDLGWVRTHFDDVLAVAKRIWGLIAGAVKTHIEAIKTVVKGISAIVGFVRDAFSKARDTVVDWKDKIVDAAGAIWKGVKSAAKTQWDLIVGIVGGAWDSIARFINKIIGGINWVIRNVPGLKGNVDEIKPLNTGGGGEGSYTGGGRKLSSMMSGSATPTVSTPRIMDNEGMGGPEAQGAEAGKGGSGGGVLGSIGGWLGDLWSKFDIWNHLPSPVTGLLGNTSKVMLGWAKDAILGLLKKFASGGDRQKIVDFAMSMLGVPYLWGGTSPAGFDCSGLIYWAYQQAGKKDFPRIPTYGGKQISSGQMQPADVLFYYPNAVQEGRTVPFGHFKMYAGHGKTVESTSGGVQVRPLDSGYAQVRSYLYDQGGWLPPGVSIAVNKTGRPEPIGASGGLVIHVDARGAVNPAAIEAAATRGALKALAQARRMSRRGAIG